MSMRCIAFDVETPNSRNDRMSAIGLTVIEHGAVVEEYETIVDPEAEFERFHMELTGITPEAVTGKPAFPELWKRIGPMMDNSTLVAHNAPFDLSVLARCLQSYGIAWRTNVPYVCTCQMSRRLLPGLPNHRLNTLCGYLGIPLDHHRAGSDSRACGEILLYHLKQGVPLTPFLRTYDLLHICTEKRRSPRTSI